MENNPDLQLMRQRHRQRLIGVGVLASLTAVGVPLLLDQARAPKEGTVSPTPSPAPVVPVVPQLYSAAPATGSSAGGSRGTSPAAQSGVVIKEELVDLSAEKEATPSSTAVPVRKSHPQVSGNEPVVVKAKTGGGQSCPGEGRGRRQKDGGDHRNGDLDPGGGVRPSGTGDSTGKKIAQIGISPSRRRPRVDRDAPLAGAYRPFPQRTRTGFCPATAEPVGGAGHTGVIASIVEEAGQGGG